MKHKILTIIGAGLLMLTIVSCREQSDELMAYDHSEELVFASADSSFAAKFKVIWNGLNQYYSLWDYEAEQGMDWDAVYDVYYPQFLALDQRGANETVTDDELKALLDQFLNPLHDSHLYITVANHKTGSSVRSMPSLNRIMQREDFPIASTFSPNLAYYANVANGEMETDDSGSPMIKECSTEVSDIIHTFAQTPGKGMMWVNDKIQELAALTSPTDLQAFQLQELKNLKEDLHQINTMTIPAAVSFFNDKQIQYNFLNIPGFDYIDPGFANKSINVKFALLKGNIAYFRLNAFSLTSYMDEKECASNFNMNNPVTKQLVEQVKEVWRSWFDSVQELHKNGTLGGVIIDLRNNGGGNMSDSQYVVGSLVPAGDIHFGYQRFKRGTGRFDYSPLMPAMVGSMSQPHETITEPVVILADCMSVSMSETSILCLKTMPNHKVIGKRTFGAICALTDNDAISYNYAGLIGVEGKTAVFGHVPSMASFTLGHELIETQGITPDIEVDFDVTQFQTTGRDSQLDRALQYIRTGNSN